MRFGAGHGVFIAELEPDPLIQGHVAQAHIVAGVAAGVVQGRDRRGRRRCRQREMADEHISEPNDLAGVADAGHQGRHVPPVRDFCDDGDRDVDTLSGAVARSSAQAPPRRRWPSSVPRRAHS